jgi:hypothetical protein
MVRLKEYTEEQLDKMRLGKLGGLYMTAYTLHRKDPSLAPQLPQIRSALFKRDDTKSKINIQRFIETQIRVTASQENYEDAAILRDMLNEYKQRVLG